MAVIAISRQTFATQVQEFYFYSLMMAIFFVIFVLIAISYRYMETFTPRNEG